MNPNLKITREFVNIHCILPLNLKTYICVYVYIYTHTHMFLSRSRESENKRLFQAFTVSW